MESLPIPEDLPPPAHPSRSRPRNRRLHLLPPRRRRPRIPPAVPQAPPPPLLGFLDDRRVFHPADPPHPSAPAASAAALAADFSLSFLPSPANAHEWAVQDVCDGRVLLDRPRQRDIDDGLRYEVVFPELVVCDPLHRRYLLLPPIPDDLAALVEHPRWKKTHRYCETFLVPAGDEDDDETSFGVIWMVQCRTKLVAALFSSSTGQWRAVSSQSWAGLFDGLLSLTLHILFTCRQYTDGCFYWATSWREKLLVLDTRRMDFSIADPPPETRSHYDVFIAMVEAAEGGPGMFLHVKDIRSTTSDLIYYTLRQDNGGSSSNWHKEETVVSLGTHFMIIGSMGCCLLLSQMGPLSAEPGCFTLDVKTFQLERKCALRSLSCL